MTIGSLYLSFNFVKELFATFGVLLGTRVSTEWSDDSAPPDSWTRELLPGEFTGNLPQEEESFCGASPPKKMKYVRSRNIVVKCIAQAF